MSNSCYAQALSWPFFNSLFKLQAEVPLPETCPILSGRVRGPSCSSQPPGRLLCGRISVSAGGVLTRCRSASHLGEGTITSSSLYLQNLTLYLMHINKWINKGMKKLSEWDLEAVRIQSKGYRSMERGKRTQNVESSRIRYPYTSLPGFSFSLRYKPVLIKGIYAISDKNRPSHMSRQAS